MEIFAIAFEFNIQRTLYFISSAGLVMVAL